MKKSLRALRSENTIILHLGDDSVNILKDNHPEIFEEAAALIEADDVDELEKKFFDFKAKIEEGTQGNFTFDHGVLKVKGTNEALPEAIMKKLSELDKAGEDFMPLIRFWKKLAQNPSQNSREQLYAFMIHNKMSLTEQGDIVCEKGVRKGNYPGHLVDCHTGTIDHSIGTYVEMPRDQVEDNPNVACAAGLHVAPPAYVRRWYSNDTLVEVVINPKDVVSVPHDYSSQKMRCCAYQVMGYAGKEPRDSQVLSLNDFLDYPPEGTKADNDIKGAIGDRKKRVGKAVQLGHQTIVREQSDAEAQIEGKTAKEIIEHVKTITGTEIKLSLKNKKGIIKAAIKILTEYKPQISLEVDLSGMTAKEMQAKALDDLGVSIGGKEPRKGRLLPKLKELYEEAGYKFKS